MISVIIPIYNVERYLSKCIDSVLNQTYKELEIILVNDGSTDSCPEICRRYEKFDSRIVYISKSNEGLSAARNIGIERARGEYLFFLDSDDYIHPRILEYLLKSIIKFGADISVANYECVIEDIVPEAIEEEQFEKITGKEGCRRIFTQEGAWMTVAWGKLYRRDLFQQIRYPNGKIHEDEFITYRLLYYSDTIAVTNQKMLYYRQRNDSIMGKRMYDSRHLNIAEAGLETIKFYKKLNEKELLSLAVEREIGLCKMLVEEFAQVKSKENKKRALYIYRHVWKKYRRERKWGVGMYGVNLVYFYSPYMAEYLEKVLWKR